MAKRAKKIETIKGLSLKIINPRDIKSYSDKKTDEADAEWLILLHSYGLLHASFQPENLARRIRNLTRHREKHLDQASRAIQHMQKALEQMDIKITNVLSAITGLSGMLMINAILEGVRNPVELARLAHSRCKASTEIFEASLGGTWDEDHLFELKESLENYRHFQRQAHGCDLKIEEFTEKFRSASAFCRWLNLVPNNKISGGKILSSHVPKRKNFAGQAFRQCANSVKDSKNLLGYYFRRQKAKGGHKYAIVCTAHKIAKIFFAMVLHQTGFDEKMCAVDEKLLLEKKIARTQKALGVLNEKLRKSA